MKNKCAAMFLLIVFLAAGALSQSAPASQAGELQDAKVGTNHINAASRTSGVYSAHKGGGKTNHPKARFSAYHLGPWESEIGYSQAVLAGRTVYISGTVGADEKGFPPDMQSQMLLAYAGIQKTMSHYGADFSNVVNEHIYTTDMDTLIKCQETRKKIYGNWQPAATWVETKRLYTPEAKIEIEVEVQLP